MAQKTSTRTQRRRNSKSRKKKQKQKQHPDRRPQKFTGSKTKGRELKTALRWLLPTGMFASCSFHGNTKWKPFELVATAICWAIAEAQNVIDAYTHTVAAAHAMQMDHIPKTYQGFIRALVTSNQSLFPLVLERIRKVLSEIGGKQWRVGNHVLFGFDGSRDTVPRSRSNEAAYCAVNYGQGTTAKYRRKKSQGRRRTKNERNPLVAQEPQIWMTMIWQVSLRIPWAWRLGRSSSSERGHVLEMLKEENFPENSLFVGDAGFVGYPLWSALVDRGHDFVVRVGGNVRLLSLTGNKVSNGIVYSWPKDAQAKNQRPLKLRLVRIRFGRGKRPVWMLTSVLASQALPARDVKEIYRQRWGIEIAFRGLKQTLNKQKLRCRNSDRSCTELSCSLLAMAVVELLGLKEQLTTTARRAGPGRGDPKRRSLAGLARVIRTSLRNATVPASRTDLLSRQLREAVTDGYVRRKSKKARYRPKNSDKTRLSEPIVQKATLETARQIKNAIRQNAV